MIQISAQIRILVAVEAIDGRKGIDAIAQLCTGTEAVRTLRAHQAQLLLAAGNPDADAPPAWRPLNP